VSAFPATRDAALQRLREFLPMAGAEYAAGRNHVPGTVSHLSPYIRHRLVSEEEIAKTVLDRHGHAAAEKFLQEICWRTYWKGWLEMRPAVWSNYLRDLDVLRASMASNHDLTDRVAAAEQGLTGIDCLDAWAWELRSTGWLHNHVRMWFASIWIHTLGLPWQLGADFFMRHLLDGDPASNTLSWRWVCGLQTQGKVYLATAGNIERFTNGLYSPHGLLAQEAPLMKVSFTIHPPLPLSRPDQHVVGENTVLLVTEEDLLPEDWGIPQSDVSAIVLLHAAESYPGIGALPAAWKNKAIEETAARLEAGFQCPVHRLHLGEESPLANLRALLQECGADSFSIMNPPVGPIRSLIEPMLSDLASNQVTLRKLRRPWDEAFWPHATHGFFKLKERIPSVLTQLSLVA
jgi:deoxyribodipyrimidine photo-lyase